MYTKFELRPQLNSSITSSTPFPTLLLLLQSLHKDVKKSFEVVIQEALVVQRSHTERHGWIGNCMKTMCQLIPLNDAMWKRREDSLKIIHVCCFSELGTSSLFRNEWTEKDILSKLIAIHRLYKPDKDILSKLGENSKLKLFQVIQNVNECKSYSQCSSPFNEISQNSIWN